jgi:hypothetical protein
VDFVKTQHFSFLNIFLLDNFLAENMKSLLIYFWWCLIIILVRMELHCNRWLEELCLSPGDTPSRRWETVGVQSSTIPMFQRKLLLPWPNIRVRKSRRQPQQVWRGNRTAFAGTTTLCARGSAKRLLWNMILLLS